MIVMRTITVIITVSTSAIAAVTSVDCNYCYDYQSLSSPVSVLS